MGLPAPERGGNVEPEACDLSKLTVRELLLLYRKHLPPGAYYFIGKDEDARSEDLIEVRVPFPEHAGTSGHEVFFGFFEKGGLPAGYDMQDSLYARHRYPFAIHVTSTSSEFQEKLASYIRARLLSVKRPSNR